MDIHAAMARWMYTEVFNAERGTPPGPLNLRVFLVLYVL